MANMVTMGSATINALNLLLRFATSDTATTMAVVIRYLVMTLMHSRN